MKVGVVKLCTVSVWEVTINFDIMIQVGRCLRTFCSSLLQERVNKSILNSYSVLPVPRIFACQHFSSDGECSDIETLSNMRSSKDSLFYCLHHIYGCSREEIKGMINASPSLLDVLHSNVDRNAKCLKENGLNKSNLLAHPWVLCYEPQRFPSVLNRLKTFHHDVNVTLHLLVIPYRKLLMYAKSSEKMAVRGEKKTIEWLSELLKCDEHKMSQVLAKHNTLLRMPRDRILNVLNILKDGGVAEKDIVRDITVFNYNTEVMVQRLAIAQENGVHSLKPWSLRCSEKVFHRTIERKVKMREFLGHHKTVKEYLATRLQCGEEEIVVHVFTKIPQLKYISVLKVKELLDYLYKLGYAPFEVYWTPRILTRSLKTVKTRVEELQLLGLVRPNLLVLCKTSREYKELVTKLKIDQKYMFMG